MHDPDERRQPSLPRLPSARTLEGLCSSRGIACPRWLWAVLIPMGVAVLTFSVAISLYARPAIISDALGYTWSARALVTQHVYNHSYSDTAGPDSKVMPGYAIFLAAFYATGPQGLEFEETVREVHPRVQVAQFILAILTVGLIAACGIAGGNLRLGLIAGLAAALYTPLAWSSTVALTETLATALISLQLLLAILLTQERAARTVTLPLAFGLASGLVALVRPIFLPWFLVPVLVFAWRNRSVTRTAARGALLSIAGVLLVLSPWWIRNAIVFERFIPLTAQQGVSGMGLGSGRLAGVGGGETLSPAEQDVFDKALTAGDDGWGAVADLRLAKEWSKSKGRFIKKRVDRIRTAVTAPYIAPAEMTLLAQELPDSRSVKEGIRFDAKRTWSKVVVEFARDLTKDYQVSLVVLGIVSLLNPKKKTLVFLAATLVFYSIAAHIGIIFYHRYFFPVLPSVILLAAASLEHLSSAAPHRAS